MLHAIFIGLVILGMTVLFFEIVLNSRPAQIVVTEQVS